MKKKFTLLMLTVLSLGSLSAQVGVETEEPTEMLDVNGTVRIQDLPREGVDNMFTKPDGTRSANKDQIFETAGTVVANENGVLGVTPLPPVRANTRCYASTTQNFSEAAARNILLYDDGEVQFEFRTRTGSSFGNDIWFKHNDPNTVQGLTKGDNNRGASYFSMPPNTWERVSSNISWDLEQSGSLILFTDVTQIILKI